MNQDAIRNKLYMRLRDEVEGVVRKGVNLEIKHPKLKPIVDKVALVHGFTIGAKYLILYSINLEGEAEEIVKMLVTDINLVTNFEKGMRKAN